MSVAALAKQLAWKHSPRKSFLKTLQPDAAESVETARFSREDSWVESKANEESLQMQICDPVRNPGWDHLIALHRDAGSFHTSAWAKVLHKTYNHHPFYLRFSRGRRLASLGNAAGNTWKSAGVNRFNPPRVRQRNSTDTHWICDATLKNYTNASTAQCAARFGKQNGAISARSLFAIARAWTIFTSFTSKRVGVTVSHRNRHRSS